MKYFLNIKKFHDDFIRLYTHPFNIFLYVKHYLSFIYAYCSSLSLSAGLLAWFACLCTGSKLGLSSDYYDVRRTRYSTVRENVCNNSKKRKKSCFF